MANCIDYCYSDPLGDPEVIECGRDPVGGLSAVILLECNHELTDPSSAAQVNAEIAAGRATLVQRASLTVDKPSPVTQESKVPCETPSLVTYDRKGVYENPNVTQQNISFHDNLFDGRRFGGMIMYECGTAEDDDQYVTWIDAAVKFTGGRVIPAKDTEGQSFQGDFAWRGMRNPQRYPAPAGIFS
jgi:hypothetical protein